MTYSPIVLDQKHRDMFDARVERRGPDACWLWTGQIQTLGYGVLTLCEGSDRKNLLAHRVAWAVAHKTVPTDQMVCHTCDNPPCCNPAHLFLGDAKANSADMIAKGRHAHGERSAMTGVKGSAHPASRYGDSQRQEAIDMYLEHRLPATYIAEVIGCNRQSVSRWLKEAGVNRWTAHRMRGAKVPERVNRLTYHDEQRDRATKLFAEEGWPIARIARELGCCRATARRMLRGVAPRSPKRSQAELQSEAVHLKYDKKFTVRKIAIYLDVHRTSVTRWLKEARELLGD